jgi:tetratricopeptide (TPR) repeat protein
VDPTVVHQPAADATLPYASKPSARTMANDQVVVGAIPAQRPGFQPRPALLAQLNQASHGRPVVLTGTWGAGKTQLAAAYARARLASGWRLIAWVNAGDIGSLLGGLAAAAEAVALSAGRSRPVPADLGQSLRSRLEADGSRCLLVFDDARDPGLLRPFVPTAGAAQVLITASRAPGADLGTHVPVEVFSTEEALALLEGRTGLADPAGAAAVAAVLGRMPLALDQAATVMARTHLGYAAYLTKLQTLRADHDLVQTADPAHRPGAAAAVLLSLETVGTADPLGVCTGVIELTAVLSPANVRRDLLRSAGQAGTLLGGGRRVAASMVDQALDRLKGRSLLDFSLDGQTVALHCLVARVMRGRLARRGRLAIAYRAAASALAASAEALAESRDHGAISELLGQVAALTENAGTGADEPDEKLAAMLTRLRFLARDHLTELGDSMPQAIAVGGQMTADLERLLGSSDPDTLSARDRLATAYRAAGRVAEAIPMFEQTLAAREALLGSDHPDTMRSKDHLARAYHQAGRVGDTIPLVQQTLAGRERLLGAGHPSSLAARNNLANVYLAAGRAAEAVPLFEQNLAACEATLGADHPRTVASRQHLDLARQKASEPGADARDYPSVNE